MVAPSAREQQVQDAVARLGSTTLETELETRVAKLEAECRRLRSAPARVVVIDHRRLKDGGRTKRQQLREARPS